MKRLTAGTGALANADEVSQVSPASLSHVAASAPPPASMIALRAFAERVTTGAPRSARMRSANVATRRRYALLCSLPGPSYPKLVTDGSSEHCICFRLSRSHHWFE